MPIDYFSKTCKTTSNKATFGLCDDPSPSSKPAYIDEKDRSKWIAKVCNTKNKEIDFYAIDKCVDIKQKDGNMEKRCDGVLSFENKLIFIELKERKGGQWFKIGREQLTATILRFKKEVGFSKCTHVSAFVCNKLKPRVNSGQQTNIQQFKDETGLILEGKATIKL